MSEATSNTPSPASATPAAPASSAPAATAAASPSASAERRPRAGDSVLLITSESDNAGNRIFIPATITRVHPGGGKVDLKFDFRGQVDRMIHESPQDPSGAKSDHWMFPPA